MTLGSGLAFSTLFLAIAATTVPLVIRLIPRRESRRKKEGHTIEDCYRCNSSQLDECRIHFKEIKAQIDVTHKRLGTLKNEMQGGKVEFANLVGKLDRILRKNGFDER